MAQLSIPDVSFDTLRKSHAIWGPVVRRYFRSEVRRMDRIPQRQCLLVAHHDGGVLPINGICFGVAWYDHFRFERPLYVLAHDLIHRVFEPFTDLLPRSGLVPADRSVMDRVVSSGHSMLVFPGAARETFRPFWERRNIDLGGRVGFVRQALRHALPIVPVVSAGSHETLIVLTSGQKLAERIGLRRLVRSADALPIMLGLPWGLWAIPALPQLPLPAKVTTEILDPIELSGDPEDPITVKEGFDRVLSEMQAGVNRLYAERRWPVIG
ncbi:MAG: glycerol acyltransferase [Polyangiaceae bacterium]|nr:glycerol acyltransferase [Polyangiaceae bacterium]